MNEQLKTLTFDYRQTERVAQILRAINHKLRRKILKLIDKECISVTQVYKALKIKRCVASQQLSILRKAGVVKGVRNGKEVYYKPDYEQINEIMKSVEAIIKVDFFR
jgi:Predicted transcriptional regulators